MNTLFRQCNSRAEQLLHSWSHIFRYLFPTSASLDLEFVHDGVRKLFNYTNLNKLWLPDKSSAM